MQKTALIVAHGQPSDPAPAEAELSCLAHGVQTALGSRWRVIYATLAAPGALERAVAQAPTGGIVYPLFMADGWFTQTHLPDRLSRAQAAMGVVAAPWHFAEPFGLDAGVQDLTITLAREAAQACGRRPAEMSILLAAHGSSRSAAPSDVAHAMAARIAAEAGFARVAAGFIDQAPQVLHLAAEFRAPDVVLPFFAAKGGHVTDDLPRALAQAGSDARLLEPVGLDLRVPGLIACALRRAWAASGRPGPWARLGWARLGWAFGFRAAK